MKKYITFFLFISLWQTTRATVTDTVAIYSNAMHTSYKCVVITPDAAGKGTQRFPVVYLLHGHGGNYANWINKVPALQELAESFGCIIVCPDGAVGSWYVDSPVDSAFRYETYIAKEVPAYIDHRYPTLATPRYRAITGLSMGGHGALYLAIRHPEIFGAAGSISGGVDIRPFPKNWDIAKRLGPAGNKGTNWNDYTVINLVDKIKPGSLPLIIDCGVKDFFIDVNRNLHQKLLQLGIPHDYIERPGEHNWAYWSNAIHYQLLFFHRYFQ
ncbi:alpha/beta hydrolase [Chitinophaga nivalis]|uniref:Esterase family protein n=1 Tax=Chitinophaga nivalis TaxID=2991709 RepID=A0ABT3IFQ5_9BACT|nr:alpha/beta hydrolase family protein [Chitinophaga nivalis]MCW3467516.1 esterase family protein [Chitinophaga nivalis]MCW3482792.1 esterase family protein [Chitinophaga nivalis]